MRWRNIFGASILVFGSPSIGCSGEEGTMTEAMPGSASPEGTMERPGASPAAAAGTPASSAAGSAAPPSMTGMRPAESGPSGASPSTQPETTPAEGEGDSEGMAEGGEACDEEGLAVEGLMYSPGGNVLPRPCEPFDPTTNNPYAIRCIDAWPWYDTGFPGDEYCILPPDPEKGIQVGFWPHGQDWYEQVKDGDLSGYENLPDEWTMQAGEEETVNYQGRAPNEEPFDYYRTYFRMRTGSHHNIISLHDSSQLSGDAEAGWIPSFGDALPGLFSGGTVGVLGGQQRPDDHTPVTQHKPPEDEGLYLPWPARPYVVYNLHHFNTFGEQTLKEGWVNIWFEDDARRRVSWYMGLETGQVLTLNLSPGETADYHYSWPISGERRLLRVFGHRHLWTSNFSSWIERADGSTDLIYQSFDWFDMPTFRYDSAVQNPEPNPELRVDGATSGVLNLQAGDELHFNCHMEFTEERAAAENAPSPTEVGGVVFANEIYSGEMCIMFGNVVGGSIGRPMVADGEVPDFAQVD